MNKDSKNNSNKVKIRSALISVFDKNGIVELAEQLVKHNIEILSTGGSYRLLLENGIQAKEIADYTGFPEMMDGRVKTLHPKVHGGLLAKRDDESHLKSAAQHDIQMIDLVIINLYPFANTVRSGSSYAEIVEQIDIGGPAMIRSAAKNHDSVTVITDINDYKLFIQQLSDNNGEVTESFRKEMAGKAFSLTASYDTMIGNWLNQQNNIKYPAVMNITANKVQDLRYGENPTQKAGFYGVNDPTIPNHDATIITASQFHGKELSFNNIADSDAAWQLVSEFPEPAIAIIKHANPCGVAQSDSIISAWHKALACDSNSAFGGIVAANRIIDEDSANALSQLFLEAIIAPGFNKTALEILRRKKNLRILAMGDVLADKSASRAEFKTVSGGLLVQDYDNMDVFADEQLINNIPTKNKPNSQQIADMKFAFAVCKHVKSNAIILAKDNAAIGIGAGQMSRVDSTRFSIMKAKSSAMARGINEAELISGSVMASDAFLPFADNVELAAHAGIKAIIQPGGSVRDDEVIAAANDAGIAMIFTGRRCFKH